MLTHPGDDGTTTIMGPGRVAKDDLRVEALGDLDEAMAALGMARAWVARESALRLLAHVQEELMLLMAEVAALEPERVPRRLGPTEVASLETDAATLNDQVGPLAGFVLPGVTAGGAALHLARAIVRRAERRVVALQHRDGLSMAQGVAYLNRLSLVLFLLACREDRATGVALPPVKAE
jgi:cob(I)alamin adenosyltransferase